MTLAGNRLTESLGEVFSSHLLEEKVLLAPNARVGHQWLDAVAASGAPVVNARVKTLTGFAYELALPAMEDAGLGYLRGMRRQVILARLFERARGGKGYLAVLPGGPGLARRLARTIQDMRVAGLRAADLAPGGFEVALKGSELQGLLAEYERELASSGFADYADALRLAAGRLEDDPAALGPDTIVLIPGDLEKDLRGLERALMQAIPEGRRISLTVDEPADPVPASDARLLTWIEDPAGAPTPAGDGTASVFRAVGETNEVREVFRRCSEGGIPLDDVEVVYTDADVYPATILEVACLLDPANDDLLDAPVTLMEGIPVRYSRPARALLGWLAWSGERYRQAVPARMVSDGLLEVPDARASGFSFNALASILRSLAIGGGPERYLPAVDSEIASIQGWLERHDTASAGLDGDTDEWLSDRKGRERRVLGLRTLRPLVEALISGAPPESCSQADYVRRAAAFLGERSRCAGEFDTYCRKSLVDELHALAGCLEDGDLPGWGPAAAVSGIVDSARVEGKGPCPGRMYATPLEHGGHSGRGHTFIVGLDDGRFPGGAPQDPLLLDQERGRLSGELGRGSEVLASRSADLAGLLARLRGSVTLSYPARSLEDDREVFAAQPVLAAFRILDKRDATQEDLRLRLSSPASFAPLSERSAVRPGEWWLWRLCVAGPVADAPGVLGRCMPHLARGYDAEAARASVLFTEYDGYVREAAARCDPCAPGGPALSARRLETLGRCPMDYFFRYVLEVEPPEELEAKPGEWLEPSERGEVLHSCFRVFVEELIEDGLRPGFERDMPRLTGILDDELERKRKEHEPPNEMVFDIERRGLLETARVFLREEERSAAAARPLFLEVAIGMPTIGRETPLDTPDALELTLCDGMTVRAVGRVDRVEQVEGGGVRLWDYKTGSAYGYDQGDPFEGGRKVQHVLYTEMIESRLAEALPGAGVEGFGYFFPGPREFGRRVYWVRSDLEPGRRMLVAMCRLLAAGCFPFTDASRPGLEMRFSDYLQAYGEVELAGDQVRAKLANPANTMLDPYRDLRGKDTGKGAGK